MFSFSQEEELVDNFLFSVALSPNKGALGPCFFPFSRYLDLTLFCGKFAS